MLQVFQLSTYCKGFSLVVAPWLAGPGCAAYMDEDETSDARANPLAAVSNCILPLEVFKLFDRDKKGKVPILELFLALALYSTGEVKDRMAFCFNVFDDDGNQSLDPVSSRLLTVGRFRLLPLSCRVGTVTFRAGL